MREKDWEELKNRLSVLDSPVKLKIDNYDVAIVNARKSMTESAFIVYIDGKINFKWLVIDNDEFKDIRERFFRKRVSKLYSNKTLKEASKKHRKRLEEAQQEFVSYYPYWTNLNSLKRHLIKNNENIELPEV